MAKSNKAERVVKRFITESIYNPDRLGDIERLQTDVYFKICTHLGNPARWPIEYTEAYQDAMLCLET